MQVFNLHPKPSSLGSTLTVLRRLICEHVRNERMGFQPQKRMKTEAMSCHSDLKESPSFVQRCYQLPGKGQAGPCLCLGWQRGGSVAWRTLTTPVPGTTHWHCLTCRWMCIGTGVPLPDFAPEAAALWIWECYKEPGYFSRLVLQVSCCE